MSSSHFRVQSHVIPGQHIREYPRATLGEQEAVFRLSVKQYTPLDNLNPQPGDLTIIGAHANGFPKELYEPLWDELLLRSTAQGFRIRGIWISDVAQQGQSGVLNEDILGNDPSWSDHPRDLLHIINHFRAEMPRPLMAIGHSMGGNQLIQVSLLHPRLFTSVVLLDPVIQREPSQPKSDPPQPLPTQLSTFRRDLWPSRTSAEQIFRKNPFYGKWDTRVVDRWVEYGLRDLPTPLYPNSPQSADPSVPTDPKLTPVTLTTTKHQEVFTFLRPNWDIDPVTKDPINSRDTVPDWDPSAPNTTPFYRPEPVRILYQLPFVRPSVLWIFAGDSPMSPPHFQEEKLRLCGAGVGGSGGIKEGRVKGIVLEGVGHLVAQEVPGQCADHASEWIGVEMRRWRELEERFRAEWKKKSRAEKTQIGDKYKQMMGGPPKRPPKAVAGTGKEAKL